MYEKIHGLMCFLFFQIHGLVSFLCNYCSGHFICFYKLMRKKVKKSEIEQDKQSITKENTDRTEKNKKVMHQFEQPLPKDTIRKTLVEWERTLPFHEQRRSYETMQQWLSRICRTRDIIPIYESVRYGEKDVYRVRCGKDCAMDRARREGLKLI